MKLIVPIIAAALFVFAVATELLESTRLQAQDPVLPNWAAITAWPEARTDLVEATPDPNRGITAIVLDDSGSMGSDIEAAKAAVVEAVRTMKDGDRVAVVALNAGVVLPFSEVSDARSILSEALRPIKDDGTTPLTKAMLAAKDLLEQEAGAMRGFGTYRVIVTTDGVADNSTALEEAIEDLAAMTPIQIATIGIGIDGNHVLRRSDLGTFVDVANVSALQDALQAAIAENTDFAAITDFGG